MTGPHNGMVKGKAFVVGKRERERERDRDRDRDRERNIVRNSRVKRKMSSWGE